MDFAICFLIFLLSWMIWSVISCVCNCFDYTKKLTNKQCLQLDILEEVSKGLFTIHKYLQYNDVVVIAIKCKKNLFTESNDAIQLVETYDEGLIVYLTEDISIRLPTFAFNDKNVYFATNGSTILHIELRSYDYKYTRKEAIDLMRNTFVSIFDRGIECSNYVTNLDWTVDKDIANKCLQVVAEKFLNK